MEKEDSETLESLIDKYSLSGVVEELGKIAHGKAEHLVSNWQSPGQAGPWDIAGNYLEQVASSDRIERVD